MNSYQVLFAAMVVVSLVRLPTRQLWWLKWSRHWLLYWWSIVHILCWLYFFLIQIFQPSYLDLTFAQDRIRWISAVLSARIRIKSK